MPGQAPKDHLNFFTANDKKANFLAEPGSYLLLTGIVILIIPVFFWGQSVVVYFDKPHITIAGDIFIYSMSVVLFIFWIIYTFALKLTWNKYLTWTHVIITLGIIFFYLITSSWFLKSRAQNEVQASILKVLMINTQHNLRATSPLGILFIVGQFAFLTNVARGFVYKRQGNRYGI